jgi:hypothetical protein
MSSTYLQRANEFLGSLFSELLRLISLERPFLVQFAKHFQLCTLAVERDMPVYKKVSAKTFKVFFIIKTVLNCRLPHIKFNNHEKKIFFIIKVLL